MTSFVDSVDGTKIAFDRLGDGPPVIVVGGMFCDRRTMRALAEQLAERFTVINYDRRGRGSSSDTPPYAVEHELEDLAALIREAGGSAAVYGHSSGAGLAIRAAAAGLPITQLVLHEPPYGPDDDESKRSAMELAEDVRVAIAEDRRSDAIELFFAATGMPAEMVDNLSGDLMMQAIAPTMAYDFEIMGDDEGGTIPEDLIRAITVRTLVISGSASEEFFQETAARVTDLLPDAEHVVLAGQHHGAPAELVAPVVTDFLESELSVPATAR
jgi:pimeloyl-ACP methyl ester carboxylesterase